MTIQLEMIKNVKNHQAVIEEVRDIFSSQYEDDCFEPIERVFGVMLTLFAGDFPGYRACNTQYHDLDHTLGTYVATARLVYGWNIENEKLKVEQVINLLVAALFHDTGYIQEGHDESGSGAKYTIEHVKRSIDFLIINARHFSVDPADIKEISDHIKTTGVDHSLSESKLLEQQGSYTILGTADLIAQMSDRAYLEKLLFLYYEFQEAGIMGFQTEFDMLKNTLAFYELTMQRLNNDFQMSYRLVQNYFKLRHGIDENIYLLSIENQMNYLKEIIEDAGTNFRKKLRRLDVEQMANVYSQSSVSA